MQYSTPGVHYQWPGGSDTWSPVRTDIAGLVGIAECGPLHTPLRINSWRQYKAIFGGHIKEGYLAYAVQGFFANGGRSCYVVRVADPDAAENAQIDLHDPRSGARVRLTAGSPGVWANRLEITVLFTAGQRFTLILESPSQGLKEIWHDLSLESSDERHVVRVLSPARRTALNCSEPPDPIQPSTAGSQLVKACLLDHYSPSLSSIMRIGSAQNRGRMEGGKNGLRTLQPEHLNGELGETPKTDKQGKPIRWGLAALADVPQVALVAMPDLIPPREQSLPPVPPPIDCRIPEAPSTSMRAGGEAAGLAEPDGLPPIFSPQQVRVLRQSLVAHCEKLKDRIALLEPPPGMFDPRQLMELRHEYDSSHAALYFPWLRVPDPLQLDGPLRSVPPCGHLAGMFARTELARGVHKPPANELLEMALDVTREVDTITHGVLNEADINVLRMSSARGLRAMGAHTLSSDPQWRFINVRRLLLNIERNLQINAQWLPFEPNNPELWREVDRVIRSYLTGLYQQGVLDGQSPEQAFFVECSPASNPPFLTDQGQMIARIGVCPPGTAEFIIVRVGRAESGLFFVEET